MNDEIKEIIKWLEDEDIYVEDCGYKYKRISLRETKILLDYITNLQQENEYLKKHQRFHKKFGSDYIFCLEGDNKTYKDMVLEKQEELDIVMKRIDKAIEYINKHCVSEKASKAAGFKCYTMADTNELEHIMKLLGSE